MTELNTFNPTSDREIVGDVSSEFADWLNTDTIEGAKIVVHGYTIVDSQMNLDDEGNPAKKAIVDVTYHEEEDTNHYGWSTESKTILRQLKTQQYPFLTAIERVPLKSNPKWKTLSFSEV